MKFLPLILKNLFRNKRRTILTVMSLAVSLFVFAALMSLPSVVNQILRARADSLRLISHSKGGLFYPLPEAYRRQIASMSHVELVTGENIFFGTYLGPHDQIPSVAVDPEDIDAMFDDFRNAADICGDDRHFAGHGFQRSQPERLQLAWH